MDLTHMLSVRIYGINKYSSFEIKENENDQDVNYTPNSNLNLGFGFSYKWFGLGLAFNFPFINNDNDIYGTTKRFDAQTSIFTSYLSADIYMQSYKGFYIENPESYLTGWKPEMPYPQRPDIQTLSFGGNCIYHFNHKKYSARATYVQTELQKKSAGSFLLGGFFTVYGITGDSSLIPYELKEEFEPELHFYKVNVSGVGVAFGYSHTFVMWKKLYFSLTLVPGVAVQKYKTAYQIDVEDREGSIIAGRFMVRTAIVYNSVKSYGGMTVNTDSFSGHTGPEQQNNLSYQVGTIRFFYGRRFDLSKK
jgi:hypothetical protein